MTIKKIEEICSLVTDGKHGDCENQANSGFFFLSCKDIRNGKMNYDNPREITEEDFKETHRRTNLSPGDVLITNSGTIGRLAVAPNHPFTFRTTFQKSVALLKPKPNLVDSDYLYYYLIYKNRDLVEFAGGTTQKNLLLKDIRAFEVRLPSLEAQKNISGKLKLLDQKIELNNQINETLESIARSIFKEWFIDFGPLKVKAEGKKPFAMDDETASLFPDTLEDSDLGQIPKGWKPGTLRDIANVTGGYAFKSSDFSESGHPVVKIKNISESLDVRLDDVDYVSTDIAAKAPKFHLKDGSLVMAMTGATVGKFGLVLHTSGLTPVLNQRVALLEPKDKGIGFLLSALLATNVYEQIVNRAEGSAQPNISADGIMDSKVLIPPTKLREAFSNLVNPLFDLWQANKKESVILKNTRDLLLPKLISGEIELKELDV